MMKRLGLSVMALVAVMGCQQSATQSGAAGGFVKWPTPTEWTSTGRNPYFILEPGYVLLLKSKDGDSLTITVLDETKTLDGVETRIVEERETSGGKLVEVSRNYFALGKKTHDLFYFGEDVDMYKDGKIEGHGGSWHAGVDGAKAGLIIPGTPMPGQKFYQENAPKVALDRSEVISVSEAAKCPAGSFTKCLKVADTSDLEAGTEYKVYAPDVGLVSEEEFELVSYGKK